MPELPDNKKLRLKCDCCDREEVLKSHNNAFVLGWDFLRLSPTELDLGLSRVVTCPDCPTSPFLFLTREAVRADHGVSHALKLKD